MLFLVLVSLQLIHSCGAADGTPTVMETIMLGRCYDYKHTVYSGPYIQDMDCVSLVKLFTDVIKKVEECSVAPEQFLPFIDAAMKMTKPVPSGKTMLWTRTYDAVTQYAFAGKRFYLVANLMPGYMLDKMNFCGSTLSASGYNNTACATWGKCVPNKATSLGYWSMASKRFAENAQGIVKVMLNGSVTNAYRTLSIFYTHELPSLILSRVEKVQAMVVYSIDKPRYERCGQGNLVRLQNDVVARGLKFDCVDDPERVRLLLCVDHPDSEMCDVSGAVPIGGDFRLVTMVTAIVLSIYGLV